MRNSCRILRRYRNHLWSLSCCMFVMKRSCLNFVCAAPENVIKDGKFQRKDDSKWIQRYRCKSCGGRFSSATFSDFYRQKKRRINSTLFKNLASNMSMRRCAQNLGIDKKTVHRRLPFLAKRARSYNEKLIQKFKGCIHNIQLDDLITKENSKCKPLSVTIVVDEDRRTILATEVSQIPAFGHLAKIALKKYGIRKDEHFEGLDRVFKKIAPLVNPQVRVRSDEHQRYPSYISSYLPKAKHEAFKSERASVAGQGELKKIQFDPLFVVNHTCAMMRANVNRLIRKTWCTTKDPNRLKDHLDIFIFYYNRAVLERSLTPL